MSKIIQFGRQYASFDPANAEHRAIFHSVLVNKTWGRSPVRFWLDDEQTDLMYQCTKKMAHWYMEQEFGALGPQTLAEQRKKAAASK